MPEQFVLASIGADNCDRTQNGDSAYSHWSGCTSTDSNVHCHRMSPNVTEYRMFAPQLTRALNRVPTPGRSTFAGMTRCACVYAPGAIIARPACCSLPG